MPNPTPSIRKQRQIELNKIFESIMAPNSYLMTTFISTLDRQDKIKIKELLAKYKTSLIKELEYLPIDYDHPLRAAKALANLNDPSRSASFASNLELFNQEVLNSKYYPETRRLGAMIQDLLVIGVIVALFIALPGVIIPMALSMLTWVAFSSSGKWNDESPVFQARKNGKMVGLFFSAQSQSDERPKLSLTTEDKSNIQIAEPAQTGIHS
jgi:hypothetical protein